MGSAHASSRWSEPELGLLKASANIIKEPDPLTMTSREPNPFSRAFEIRLDDFFKIEENIGKPQYDS